MAGLRPARLQEKRSALSSALILGAIWGLWHLPLFCIRGTTQSFLAFIPFVLWVTGVSILFTWVYDNTTGSLLIPVLLHTTVNFFAAILAVLPTDVSDSTCPFLPYTLLVCLLTAIVVFVTGPRLSSKTRSRAAPP